MRVIDSAQPDVRMCVLFFRGNFQTSYLSNFDSPTMHSYKCDHTKF